jgi:hypothetical protein
MATAVASTPPRPLAPTTTTIVGVVTADPMTTEDDLDAPGADQ